MHIGVSITLSKNKAMHFPLPRVEYSNAYMPCFKIRNADGSTVGFVDFTKEFTDLGSIIDSSLTSYADVDVLIETATSAFGAFQELVRAP